MELSQASWLQRPKSLLAIAVLARIGSKERAGNSSHLAEAILSEFGQAPRVIEVRSGPCKRFESGARCCHRRALQGDIFQYLRAIGLAFFAELFRGCFDGLEDRRVR